MTLYTILLTNGQTRSPKAGSIWIILGGHFTHVTGTNSLVTLEKSHGGEVTSAQFGFVCNDAATGTYGLGYTELAAAGVFVTIPFANPLKLTAGHKIAFAGDASSAVTLFIEELPEEKKAASIAEAVPVPQRIEWWR